MPKTSNYANCKFYRLVSCDPSVAEVYIGHTCNEVKRRYDHKSACTNAKSKKYNLFVYSFIREHGGWTNWQLIVHEQLAVKDKIEAALRERYWLEHYNAVLNSKVPSRTQTESGAKYRVEHVKEQKEYRTKTRDKIKETHAKHYIANQDKIKAYASAYHAAHADHLKEKHTCECGGKYITYGKSRHLRSARHCTFITAQAAL